MSTDSRGYISTNRYLVSKGKGFGLPLTPRETETVLTLMAGNETTDKIASVMGCNSGTVHWNLNQIYAKAGASNLTHVVMMITGVVACPSALLPVQRTWRRKHYKLDD